jgi:MOSC domain
LSGKPAGSEVGATDQRRSSGLDQKRSDMARLLSVNVGLPRDIKWNGRTVHTAIWKDPVRGRRRVGRLNLEGDGQGDLAGHGGEQRAVFVYQIESYRYWQERLKRTGLVHGQFGENLPSKDCTAAPMFVTAGRTRAIRSVKISMPPATYRDQSFAKSASQEKLMSTSAGRLASWQMKEALATLGVAPERIHIEIFNGSESMTPGVVGTATRAPHLPKGDANFGPLVSFARSGIAAHWKRMPPTMLPKNGKERLFTWAEVSRRSAGRNSRPMKTN